MSRRIAVIVVLALAVLAAPLGADAQQQAKVARIGVLATPSASSFASRIEAFKQGLRELGYVEGQNIGIDYRWAEGRYERLPELAAELVRLKVDVIVTHTTPGTRAAQQATTTIPIVMATSGDAVAAGLVASLARPGGNTTGSSFFTPELSAKRLELLKEALPRIRRAATLMLQGDQIMSKLNFEQMEITGRSLKIEVRPAWVRGEEGMESTFSALAKARTDALVLQDLALFNAQARRIGDLAGKHRLPMAAGLDFVQAGALLSYGPNLDDLFRRAATFVDKILKGAKPADLPVEQPTKFELIVNLKTAKALGLTVQRSVLIRADRVIQ